MPDTVSKSTILPNLPAVPSRSETLVLAAEHGEKLEVGARRDALAYLTVVRPDLSNIDLARLFDVSEGMIRKDKDFNRKRMAEELGSDDISLVINDIRRTYEVISTELQKSLKECSNGTMTKLNHLKTQMEFQMKYVEALQSLGFLPKNLGNLTKTQFIFKAHVAKGGGVSTVAVEDRDALKTIEAQEYKQLPVATETTEETRIRAQLEAEFAEVPQKVSPNGATSTDQL
jgi:hypothetical protein